MQIIDIHTHVYPKDIAQKATDSVRHFYDIGTDGLVGTIDQLLQRKKAAGIDKCVVLPVAIRPDRVRGINAFILEEAAQPYPKVPGHFGHERRCFHLALPDSGSRKR